MMDESKKTAEMAAEPTAAEAVTALVDEGATAEGDDTASVLLAAVAGLDMASDKGLPLGTARVLALRFGDDGEVSVHALDDTQAAAALPALTAEGVKVEKFTMADVQAFIEAAQAEDGDDKPEGEGSEMPEGEEAAS